MKGLGLAAVRERIRKSFLEVHQDQRTREQLQADEEMIASVQMDAAQAPQVEREVHSLSEQSNVLKNTTEQRANAYIGAALRSPQVAKLVTHRRSNVYLGWEIEAPTESADALIQQALRQFEGK